MSTRKNTSGHFKCCEDGTVLGAGFKGRHVWLLGWGGVVFSVGGLGRPERGDGIFD